MQLSGTVHKILDVEIISEKFSKRAIVIKTDDEYPQVVSIEFINKSMPIIEKFSLGDQVIVDVDIRGREWTDKKTGRVRYFTNISGWKISNANTGGNNYPTHQQAPAPGGPGAPGAPADDDIPFQCI